MSSTATALNPSEIPLLPNPYGGPSNFVNPPTLLPAILGVGVAMIALSTLSLIVRLWANIMTAGKLYLDDYLCIFAEAGGISYWAVIYAVGLKGAATHSWDVPVSIITPWFIKIQYVQQTIIAPTMWAAKASIFALYIRLFGTYKWLRWTCYGLLVFTALVFGANIVIAAVFCIPHDGQPWNAMSFARCSKPVELDVAIGAFTVAADITLFLIPFPIILHLQLNKRKKRGLAVIFLVGILTVICSVASLVYRVLVYKGDTKDPLWIGLKITITTFTEVFGTIIVSCAPGMASWYNIMTKTKLYMSLKNSYHASRSRLVRSSSGKPEVDSTASSHHEREWSFGKRKEKTAYTETEDEAHPDVSL